MAPKSALPFGCRDKFLHEQLLQAVPAPGCTAHSAEFVGSSQAKIGFEILSIFAWIDWVQSVYLSIGRMNFAQLHPKRRVAPARKGGLLLTPSCFRVSVLVVALTCVASVSYALYAVTSSLGHRANFTDRAHASRWDTKTPESASPTPRSSEPLLRRPAVEPPGRNVLGPQPPARKRKILLSEGFGKWNTGVWPNWGSPDVELNCTYKTRVAGSLPPPPPHTHTHT
jgi:hypothetical protein